MRVTNEHVFHALQWARNYGDVEKWALIGKRGRKWKVTLPVDAGSVSMTGAFDTLDAVHPENFVPSVMVLTSREVIVLCYGLAFGGERVEPRCKKREAWNW